MAFDIMAMIQSDAGDHYGAQESLTGALKYLDENRLADQPTLSNVYNELGMSSTDLKNYGQAIKYFDKAYKFSVDSNWTVTILNNKGLAYQNQGAYKVALDIYRQILPRAKGADRARIMTNKATAEWLKDTNYPAAAELRVALTLWQKENDKWGLNSIYLSLVAYYEKVKPDSALIFAKKRLTIASELHSPDDKLEALTALIKISPPYTAKSYFLSFQKLSDSVQLARNAAKNQFALIRYNVEKSQADNLRLQKDVAEKRYQLFLAVSLSVFVVSGLSFYFWWRRRKMRLQQELAIRDSEMQVAKKVHDGVANGIYQLMSEVEHGLLTDNEELADKLDLLYQRSRDISYEKAVVASSAFDRQLSVQLRAFGGQNCHISLTGNSPELWSGVPDVIRQNLNYILLELMVNMKKHSRAANVLIKFEVTDHLHINYSDDGVGLAPNVRFGNGLVGTENRIQAMGGVVTFDGGPGKGLKIAIIIPL
ncbi:tetratricopeptide repeat protein [Mucilaginibacter sp. CAU 1740]